MPTIQEINSLESIKFLTKAELVEQIVRPLEEVCVFSIFMCVLRYDEVINIRFSAKRQKTLKPFHIS